MNILDKAINTHNLEKEEIIELFNYDEELFKGADFVREKYVGNEIHLRGLIEFSNFCKRNCKYCGIRCDNEKVKRYRLNIDDISKLVHNAIEMNYKTIVLQSGEDEYFNTDRMCEIIKMIKKYDLALTLSVGEKGFEDYLQYKNAGADRFLIRIETTDKVLYEKMHPNMKFENRKKCLSDLKKLGFEVGTGCLVGLPTQTLESLADDILFFKSINADMIGIGPFIPSEDTPLSEENGGSFDLALKVMAIIRLLLPDVNIPATTAMETLHPNGRIIALQSGANVVMPNLTEAVYRDKYSIYPQKAVLDVQKFKNQLKTINRTISTDYGYHKSSGK